MTTAALVIVILALCQAAKMAGLKSRWIPLLAVALGLVWGWYSGGVDWTSLITGITTGLASVGLWEISAKSIAGK